MIKLLLNIDSSGMKAIVISGKYLVFLCQRSLSPLSSATFLTLSISSSLWLKEVL
jgi:hypothetical protein